MQSDFRDDWLSQLGLRLHIPTLAFDKEGLCQLSLDQELTITLYKQPNTPNLVLFGQLPVPHISSAHISSAHFSSELMRQMLIENRNHSKLTAPILSLDAANNALEVHFKLNQQELEVIDDALEQLIGSLEYWRDYTSAMPY